MSILQCQTLHGDEAIAVLDHVEDLPGPRLHLFPEFNTYDEAVEKTLRFIQTHWGPCDPTAVAQGLQRFEQSFRTVVCQWAGVVQLNVMFEGEELT